MLVYIIKFSTKLTNVSTSTKVKKKITLSSILQMVESFDHFIRHLCYQYFLWAISIIHLGSSIYLLIYGLVIHKKDDVKHSLGTKQPPQ